MKVITIEHIKTKDGVFLHEVTTTVPDLVDPALYEDTLNVIELRLSSAEDKIKSLQDNMSKP